MTESNRKPGRTAVAVLATIGVIGILAILIGAPLLLHWLFPPRITVRPL